MRRLLVLLVLLIAPALAAQSTGKFPPDSLINTKVIPHNTPVPEVVAMMRGFAGDLGVRCQYCHVGNEGEPLDRFNFASDQKRTKLVARQMMLMLREINRRIDTIPARLTATGEPAPRMQATCGTCHRGVSRPVPLSTQIADVATSAGVDSAIRNYRALRQRYYGRDAYDFSEPSLNTAAFRLARAGRFDDALALLKLNEEMYPTGSATYVTRGEVALLHGDTTAAAAAFREAIKRDSTNMQARGRLRAIGRQP